MQLQRIYKQGSMQYISFAQDKELNNSVYMECIFVSYGSYKLLNWSIFGPPCIQYLEEQCMLTENE